MNPFLIPLLILAIVAIAALAGDRVLLMFECERCITRPRAIFFRTVRGKRIRVCRRCTTHLDAGDDRLRDWSGHILGMPK